jgi:hypothetical protein
VPAAEGCGSPLDRSLIDAEINAKFGLPSAVGDNAAILNGTSKFARAEAGLSGAETRLKSMFSRAVHR